ncbi:MAG: hypothetical protein JSV08_01055 [Acidobacteriota bacterium]|nr:MAG: hypothetical protein JSV08_01055 [Acidobacteriota bacterium]
MADSTEHTPKFLLGRLQTLAASFELKPTSHGFWSLHFLNCFLYMLNAPRSTEELAHSTKRSQSMLVSYLYLAEELRLVARRGGRWSLTDAGKTYVVQRKSKSPDWVSPEQVAILVRIVRANPIASGALLRVCALVETFLASSQGAPPPAGGEDEEMLLGDALAMGLVAKEGNRYRATCDGAAFLRWRPLVWGKYDIPRGWLALYPIEYFRKTDPG